MRSFDFERFPTRCNLSKPLALGFHTTADPSGAQLGGLAFGPGGGVFVKSRQPSAFEATAYALCAGDLLGDVVYRAKARGELVYPEHLTLEMACPDGMRATGGGGVDTEDSVMTESRPVRGGKAWRVTLFRITQKAKRTQPRAAAVCVQPPASRDVVYRSKTVDVKKSKAETVVARCPGGTSLIGGGGGQFGTEASLRWTASAPAPASSPNRWEGRFYNPTASVIRATATAVCL